MIKPDPSQSRISFLYSNTFANMKKVDELEQLKLIGTPVFTEEDVSSSGWPLDKILRKLFVENNITDEYFTEKYKIYALAELGMHPNQASNNRSNLMKALKAGHITFKRFLEVTCLILGYSIENMQIDLADKDGKEQSLKFEETNRAMSNKLKSTVQFKEDA